MFINNTKIISYTSKHDITKYNLAYYSIKFGVMKEYDIDIHFKITDKFEVIDE